MKFAVKLATTDSVEVEDKQVSLAESQTEASNAFISKVNLQKE